MYRFSFIFFEIRDLKHITKVLLIFPYIILCYAISYCEFKMANMQISKPVIFLAMITEFIGLLKIHKTFPPLPPADFRACVSVYDCIYVLSVLSKTSKTILFSGTLSSTNRAVFYA